MVNGASLETLLSILPLHESGVFWGDLYAFVFTEAVLCLPTIFGNLLILISIKLYHSLRNRTSILIANLAVADLLVGAVLMPVDVASMLHLTWANDRWFCLFETALYVAFLATSVINVFIISVERFCSVVFPFWYNAHIRANFLYCVVISVWVTMSLVAILPLLGYNTYVDGKTPCNTDFIWHFGYKMLVTGITVTCLILSTILYVCVIYKAAGHNQKLRTSSQYRSSMKLRRHAKRTRLMMYVFGLFIICWCPFTVLTILCCFYQSEPLSRARKWSVLLGLLNSGMNWVVYGLLNRKFRQAFKAIILCSFKRHLRPACVLDDVASEPAQR